MPAADPVGCMVSYWQIFKLVKHRRFLDPKSKTYEILILSWIGNCALFTKFYSLNRTQQESIPVGYVLPAFLVGDGVQQADPPRGMLNPGYRPPPPPARMQNPLNADPLVGRLPCRQTPSDTDPPNADPPKCKQPHRGRPPRIRSPMWTEWQTRVKILPCPKLHLRAAMKAFKLSINPLPPTGTGI